VEFEAIFERSGRSIAVRPGDHLFRQGDRDTHLYLVKAGLLKAYYVRADGKEHIKSFQSESAMIGSMVSFIDNEPCTFSVVAIENSKTIALPYRQLEDACRSDVGLANALAGFLSMYGKRKERREYELLCLTPEIRYATLLESMADIAARVSQADIAAYIGVTPQALSRIKRRLRS